MESKYERMLNKHKKLKRKYKDLYNDIYDVAPVDDDEEAAPEPKPAPQPAPAPEPQPVQQQPPPRQSRSSELRCEQIPRGRMSWRQYVAGMN